jgi:choline kinase
MKTLILAAGQGIRLRPYTDKQPKCMVPLGGKSLLHWQMEALSACGVKADSIVIVAGYEAGCIEAPGTSRILNPRYASTNMVETLFCARDCMVPGEDLLICYGDIVYEPRVMQALLASSAPLSVAADSSWQRLWQLRMTEPLDDAETFKMDANGKVCELGQVPTSYEEVEAQYMGLIYVRGDHVGKLIKFYDSMDRSKIYGGKDFDNMYMTSFLQELIDHEWQVKSCLVNNGWLEVDTAAELELYQQLHDSSELKSYCYLPPGGWNMVNV